MQSRSAPLEASEREQLQRRAETALQRLAEQQSEHVRAADPVQRFLDLLGAAISSGQAHLAGPDGSPPYQPEAWGWRQVTVGAGQYPRDEWRPVGDRVGWIDGERLYLEPTAAYRAAQTMAAGNPVSVGEQTLWRRLRDRGMLVAGESGHLTTKHTLEGRRRRVLCMDAGVLSAPEAGQAGHSGQDDPPDPRIPASSPASCPDSNGVRAPSGAAAGALQPNREGSAPTAPKAPLSAEAKASPSKQDDSHVHGPQSDIAPPRPAGWSEQAWSRELQRRAELCEGPNPQRAAQLRAWASQLDPPGQEGDNDG